MASSWLVSLGVPTRREHIGHQCVNTEGERIVPTGLDAIRIMMIPVGGAHDVVGPNRLKHHSKDRGDRG